MWTTKLMIDGVWRGDVEETAEIAAKRAEHAAGFRGRIIEPEAGRYHLYVSYACPFAHRVILTHALKRLDGMVGMSVVHPRWNTPDGWVFGETLFSTPDGGGNGFTHLYQAYAASCRDYTGRVTVPLLWDSAARCIVSDDSRDLVRILNHAFDDLGADRSVDLFPAAINEEVEALGDSIASEISAGGYRIGAAANQDAYNSAEAALFDALCSLEARLGDGRTFLHGETVTASDILLFTPLVRFDAVYFPLFRALRCPLSDFPALSAWLRRFAAVPGIAATVQSDHILRHYYDGWGPLNPHIVPSWKGRIHDTIDSGPANQISANSRSTPATIRKRIARE